jgi:nucleoside-diphosphate-sugar epimerase
MSILITGGTGFLGSALIDKLLARGEKVYSVSRSSPVLREGLVPLRGDILEPCFGLKDILYPAADNISAVYHLAAILRLGDDKDGSIWLTNVEGTRNVIDFCLKCAIPHLYFCSTAYTQGRNTYEKSKAYCEEMLANSNIPRVTVFKPSIIMGNGDSFYLGHVSQFVTLIINTLAKVRVAWRKAEETLRLPVLLEPVLRIRGNPEGRINLIELNRVVQGMSDITDQGTFWLTNPDPPKIQQICDWIGDYIMVKLKVMSEEYKRMPLEVVFDKKITAFAPYLWGDDFRSDLKDCSPVSRELIINTVRGTLSTKS